MATDKIPTEGELWNKIEKLTEYMEKNDPRKMYTIVYKIYGNEYTEKIKALSTKDAVDKMKNQLQMVGWFPKEIKVLEEN